MGKVLVVDDDHFIADIISRFLSKYNHDVTKAYTGKDGVRLAIELLPDVVLLDRMMPDMDGTKACEILKSNQATKDIPVIFVTSKTELEDLVQALKTGAHDYISKPIEPRELIARVDAALRVKYLQDELKDKLRISRQLEQTKQHLMEQYMSAMFGQLAESLMHELNNPLMAVIGLAELVRNRSFTRDRQLIEHMEMIHEMGLRASAKLNSLLCIAKDNGQGLGVDVNKIVKDVVELVNARLLISGVQLDLELQENLREIKGNQGKLARAILALVNNAIEATEFCSNPSSKKIFVNTYQIGDEEVGIKVCDLVGNLSEDCKGKLFQPFFTTKNSSSHPGIGLYLVKNIVKEHNGKVNWGSTKDSTWFELILPL
ncbi:MAG: response regulator [Acidobacteria bacterium]|nr:response regulator [Acidobacteriota bacterium]